METCEDHSGPSFSTPRTDHLFFHDYILDWGKNPSNSSIHVVSLNTRARFFQYKLPHQMIYSNKSLHKIKLVDLPLCSFCKNSDESVKHLFCHCCFSTAFWKSVVFWLNILTLHIDFDCNSFSNCDIFYGINQGMSHWHLLNHFIVGKQMIYHNCLKNSLPTLSHVIT